jgi:hypothetical protein
MANTLTNINDTITVQEAFPHFKAKIAPLTGFSTNFSAETAAKGDTVRVGVISAKRTADERAADGTYETGDTTVATVPMQLTLPKHVSWHLTDVDNDKTAMDVWTAFAKECAAALAREVFDGVTALFRQAHDTGFGNRAEDKVTVAAASFDLDDVVELRKLLVKKGALGNMTLLASPDYAAALMKDNQVQDTSAYGSDDVVRTGEFRVPMYDIKAYEIGGFPTAVANENTGAVLAVPSAIGLAIRPVQPQAPEMLLDWQVVSDPEGTGLSMGYRRWYNTSTGVMWGAFEVIYKAAVLRPAIDNATNFGGAVRAVSA